jgi:hypothetical protein
MATKWNAVQLSGMIRERTRAKLCGHRPSMLFREKHVLPKGFYRIRRYGVLANGNRAANLANFTGLKKAGPQRSGLSLAKFKIGRVCRSMVHSVPCRFQRGGGGPSKPAGGGPLLLLPSTTTFWFRTTGADGAE